MASDQELKDLWERVRANVMSRDIKLVLPNGGLARGEINTIHVTNVRPQSHWSNDLILSLERSEEPSHLIREVKVIKRLSSKVTEAMSEVRRDIAIRRDQSSLSQALENFGNPFKES